MRWYKELVIGEPYYLVGFVDRKLTAPSIATFVFLGIGAFDSRTEGQYCFQDALSYLARPEDSLDSEESQEPSYIELSAESLDMVTDKAGLIAWLQSPHSTSAAAALNAP